MRKIAIGIFALVCVLSTCAAIAQNCKPDVAREDKITKEKVEVWTQVLSSTGFGASLMSTSEMSLWATVGRYGAANAINLEIQKREESATNAGFESAIRAAKGKKFYFGFKNGAPLVFEVTDVGNNAKVDQGLFGAKGVTTAILSAVVQEGDLGAMREALTTRQIDAVRVDLAGDQQLEKNVDEKNGRKLMEKFACFYQFLDSQGIALTASPKPSGGGPGRELAASELGKYVGKGNSTELIELVQGGTFSLRQEGKAYGGEYQVVGDTLSLVIHGPKGTGHAKLRLVNGTIVAPDGSVYEKQDAPQKPATAAVTVAQVIQMVAAKLPDDIIIKAIQKSNSKFDLGPEELINLKTSGASDAVMRAMAQ